MHIKLYACFAIALGACIAFPAKAQSLEINPPLKWGKVYIGNDSNRIPYYFSSNECQQYAGYDSTLFVACTDGIAFGVKSGSLGSHPLHYVFGNCANGLMMRSPSVLPANANEWFNVFCTARRRPRSIAEEAMKAIGEALTRQYNYF